MWAIALILLRGNNSRTGIPHFFHPSISRLDEHTIGNSPDLTYILHRFSLIYPLAFLSIHMVSERTW